MAFLNMLKGMMMRSLKAVLQEGIDNWVADWIVTFMGKRIIVRGKSKSDIDYWVYRKVYFKARVVANSKRIIINYDEVKKILVNKNSDLSGFVKQTSFDF